MKLQPDARRRLDGYLERVADAVRASGHDEAEVETVRESLREQVLEVAGRGGGNTIDSEEVGAAIATLDTPDAYGIAASGDPPTSAIDPRPPTPAQISARVSGLAKLSAGLSILGAVFVVTTGFMGLEQVQKDAAGGAFVIAELIALAAGVITWGESWGRFGAISALLLLSLLAVMVLGTLAAA